MERGYRDIGRSADFGGGYADEYRSYGRVSSGAGGTIRGGAGGGYLDSESLSPRDGVLGSPGSSGAGLRSSYGRSGFDREVVESLLNQRALQEQLSMRESQLALASALLQQQQQQQFFNKRGTDRRSGSGDYRHDFKRPRLDSGSRAGQHNRSAGAQRNQNSGGRDNARRDSGGSRSRQRSSEGRGRAAQGKGKGSKEAYNPEKPTADDKRRMQVTKGCKWCKVTSFKNFTEVLEHRSTEKHKKNQEEHDERRYGGPRGGDRKRTRSRNPVFKVELPEDLKKFDPKVVVGQFCVIATSGWFCKVCNKFYNNETTAKDTHCKTETHYNNFKKFTVDKLRAKAEEEYKAKKAAEEEERKKKKAEEAAKKEAEKEKSATTTGEGEETSAMEETSSEKPQGEEVKAEENGGETKEEGEEGEIGDAAKEEQEEEKEGDEAEQEEEMDMGEDDGAMGGEEQGEAEVEGDGEWRDAAGEVAIVDVDADEDNLDEGANREEGEDEQGADNLEGTIQEEEQPGEEVEEEEEEGEGEEGGTTTSPQTTTASPGRTTRRSRRVVN